MNIPESMIEAAAQGLAFSIVGYNAAPSADTTAHALAALTAALATCTVREEWRAKIAHPDGTVLSRTKWWRDRRDADTFVDLVMRGHVTYPDPWIVTVESRLVIETAAIPQPERTTP